MVYPEKLHVYNMETSAWEHYVIYYFEVSVLMCVWSDNVRVECPWPICPCSVACRLLTYCGQVAAAHMSISICWTVLRRNSMVIHQFPGNTATDRVRWSFHQELTNCTSRPLRLGFFGPVLMDCLHLVHRVFLFAGILILKLLIM